MSRSIPRNHDRRDNRDESKMHPQVSPTQGADAQFIAEHGHRLAELLKLDYYDIADRDAQITMLLANKLPQPSQGADARPVAIYLGRIETSDGNEAWVELGDEDRKYWHDTVRAVYLAPQEITARLAALEKAMEGISQDALDGGWTALGLSKHAKELEIKLADATKPKDQS